MKSRFVASALICCAILLSACATPKKMAFHEETQKSADQAQPVFLMTVTLKNSYKTSYQPKLLVVHVEKEGAKDSSERINFMIDDKAKQETDSADRGNSYLLRMELDPGLYQIVGFTSLAGSFPIRGIFFAPLLAPLESNGVGVYYLGHVAATVRERQEEEFRAGGVIPLIDQAVSGASGGTFDIEISDMFVDSESVFRSRFPALANVAIEKAVLPPFDRAKAQQWWEAR